MGNIPEPLNTQERYLHATVMRLDAICHMLDSFVREYAKQSGVATTENTVKEEKPKAKRTKKKVE